MIITCEKCDTRFKLDDDRVPADGVKVRCSRCQHAFVAQRPEASVAGDAAAADDLARAATEAPAQDHTQMLGVPDTEERTRVFEEGSVDFSDGAPRAPASAESDEESWEFNEEPKGPDALSPAPAATPESERPLPPPADEGVSFAAVASEARPAADPMNEFLAADPAAEEAEPSIDDVGSPEEWDLLGHEVDPDERLVGDAPSDSAGVDFGALSDATDAEPAVEAEAGAELADDVDAEAAEAVADPVPVEVPVAGDLGVAPSWQARAAHWLGVAAVAALLALVAWGSLMPSPTLAGGPVSATLGTLEAAEVHAHIVENAVVGGLLVVSAELRNPGESPRLPGGIVQVTLLDASGRALEGADALLARAPSERVLRRESPERLLAAQEIAAGTLAQTPLAAGESIPVMALFADVPTEARGFRFEMTKRISSGEDLPNSSRPAAE